MPGIYIERDWLANKGVWYWIEKFGFNVSTFIEDLSNIEKPAEGTKPTQPNTFSDFDIYKNTYLRC